MISFVTTLDRFVIRVFVVRRFRPCRKRFGAAHTRYDINNPQSGIIYSGATVLRIFLNPR